MSVFWRLVLLFVLVVVLDSALLLSLLFAGGTFEHMHEKSLSILSEVTRNRYQTLQNKMVSWSNLDGLEKEVNAAVAEALRASGCGYEDISEDSALNARLVEACIDLLITHLRTYDVSGAFLALNGIGVPGEPESYPGVYLRDSDPTGHNPSNSDLHMIRGLPPLSRQTGITLDSYWQASFRFDEGQEGSFFFKPLEAYAVREEGESKYYGYWSGRFFIHEEDNTPVFTYSRPLIGADGKAYGVLGVELDAAYVASILNNGEYGERSSRTFYFLGVTEDGGASYRNVLTSGVRFRQNFTEDEGLSPVSRYESNGASYVSLTSAKSGEELMGAVNELALYSPNTAFSGQQWALIGLQSKNTLFELENDFEGIIQIVIVLGLLLGIAIAVVAARSISRPISALVAQLRRTEHGAQPLEPTGIAEVDVLADTISDLNRRLVEDASRISKIISLSGLPIGAFEKHGEQDEVFCSDGFFSLLCCQELYSENNRIPVDTFDRLMAERIGGKPDEGEDIFLVKGVTVTRYVRVRLLRDMAGVTGTLIDVTEEVEKRRRIEHDRDFDLLTNIYNRRAFEEKAGAMFAKERESLAPVSALVMMDLDNLKAVNDSYGHDYGDLYIRTFAEGLELLRGRRCMMARRSGDEFYLLYYGYQSKEEIRKVVREGWKRLMRQTCPMPDGTRYKLRASAGIAWYPDDSEEFTQLVHYADFAMYRVKNAVKGSLVEFSGKDYSEAGYLFNGSQALDRLLDERLVRYMFQPIVSAEDGGVMGYEMLMRPMVSELPTPTAVLNLAKEQGKLYRVERLTWDVALAAARGFRETGALLPGTKLFINSIASQVMTAEDERRLQEEFGDMYGDMVLEITEGERNNDEYMNHKLENVKRFGGQIAIDDFGTGYNSDATLITIDAEYVKLDISFVRNVNQEPNKRALITNVVQYARKRGILVIAEGVETREEMETLARIGVQYYQGYYVARPAYVPPVPSDKVTSEIQEMYEKYKNRRGGGA